MCHSWGDAARLNGSPLPSNCSCRCYSPGTCLDTVHSRPAHLKSVGCLYNSEVSLSVLCPVVIIETPCCGQCSQPDIFLMQFYDWTCATALTSVQCTDDHDLGKVRHVPQAKTYNILLSIGVCNGWIYRANLQKRP